MLNVLLKKQLTEFKYSYFTNRKTGKPRSKSEIIPRLILYALLFIIMLSGVFGICMGISIYAGEKDNIWIMFTIIAFITIFVSTFINMLITRGILFEAKDNELMLSLPIPDKYIIISRMLNVFLNTLIYTFLIWAGPFIYYFIFIGFDILVLIYGIILYLFITCIVVALSCLFGYGISLLMKRFPIKNFIQTLITLVFLIAYYVIYFRANSIMTSLLANIDKFEAAMKTQGIFIYAFAKAATGDSFYLFLSFVFTVVVCALCFILILRRYRSILVATPSIRKKDFKGDYSKLTPVKKALRQRELKRFFSNSTYTLNCGLGILLIVAGAIALIIFNEKIQEIMSLFNEIPFLKEALPIVLIGAMSLITSMDALSVPAVSLEGKNYWIIRSLPVSSYDVLNSKRQLQFRMHVIPVALLAIVCTFVFNIRDILQVEFIICALCSLLFITYCDLFLGIKGANLKWNDEVFVIKQNGNIFVAIFGGMIVYAGLPILFIFVLSKYINAMIFMLLMIIIFISISLLIDRWVKIKGVKLFEQLG